MKFYIVFKASLLLLVIVFAPYWSINLLVFGQSHEVNNTFDAPRTIMVLGAGLRGDMPTQILQKRLDKAAEMYYQNKVDSILLSGSNPEEAHNEPQVMRRYLINFKNIPSSDIFVDFGGRRTIDSCWRAKNVFKLDTIYITTQAFHLARSTFLCQSLGLRTFPVIAENVPRAGRDLIYGVVREVGACWEAGSNLFNNYEPPIQGDGSEVIPM